MSLAPLMTRASGPGCPPESCPPGPSWRDVGVTAWAGAALCPREGGAGCPTPREVRCIHAAVVEQGRHLGAEVRFAVAAPCRPRAARSEHCWWL